MLSPACSAMTHHPTILLTTATKAPCFHFVGTLAAFVATLKQLQRL